MGQLIPCTCGGVQNAIGRDAPGLCKGPNNAAAIARGAIGKNWARQLRQKVCLALNLIGAKTRRIENIFGEVHPGGLHGGLNRLNLARFGVFLIWAITDYRFETGLCDAWHIGDVDLW